MLGTPLLGILHRQGNTAPLRIAHLGIALLIALLRLRLLPVAYGGGSHLLSVCIIQTHPYVTLSKQRHIGLQHTVTVIVYQIGHNAQILDMTLCIATIQIAVTGYTTQPPEILVLTPGTVAPTENLKGDEVLTRVHIFRDIKLCLDLRVLAITHELTVHPEVDT